MKDNEFVSTGARNVVDWDLFEDHADKWEESFDKLFDKEARKFALKRSKKFIYRYSDSLDLDPPVFDARREEEWITTEGKFIKLFASDKRTVTLEDIEKVCYFEREEDPLRFTSTSV